MEAYKDEFMAAHSSWQSRCIEYIWDNTHDAGPCPRSLVIVVVCNQVVVFIRMGANYVVPSELCNWYLKGSKNFPELPCACARLRNAS
jgi:hypothetical protein